MTTWLDDRAAEIRARLSPTDEGALWLLFLDDPEGEAMVACAIDDATNQMDEVLLQNIEHMINCGPWSFVLVAVPRTTGSPREIDRRLWAVLDTRTSKLIDLIVVGVCRHWSARNSSERRTR